MYYIYSLPMAFDNRPYEILSIFCQILIKYLRVSFGVENMEKGAQYRIDGTTL